MTHLLSYTAMTMHTLLQACKQCTLTQWSTLSHNDSAMGKSLSLCSGNHKFSSEKGLGSV